MAVSPRTSTTLTQFLIDQRRRFPDASGNFNAVVLDVALACKAIAKSVSYGALADMLGSTAGLAFMGLLAFRGFADIPKFIKQNSQQEMLGFPHWIVAAFIGVCAVSTSLVLINQIWLAMLRLRDAWGNAEVHPHNT